MLLIVVELKKKSTTKDFKCPSSSFNGFLELLLNKEQEELVEQVPAIATDYFLALFSVNSRSLASLRFLKCL
jgi:hypothetical protein